LFWFSFCSPSVWVLGLIFLAPFSARSFFTTNETTPPAEVAPTARSAMVAIHAGHIELLLSPLPPKRTLLCGQARDFDHRPDFDGSLACHGNLCGDGDGLVQIFCIDEEIAPQLLARLGERTVGHEPLAVAHPNTRRHRRGVQRVRSQILPVGVERVCELHGLLVTIL